MKNSIRETTFWKTLQKSRYLFYRYIVKKNFKNQKILGDYSIMKIDKNDVNFFGYYNLNPDNKNGDILYLTVKDENIRGSTKESASIMIKSSNGNYKKISETKCWNWQQGAMQQWLPISKDCIIFNDYNPKTKRYFSKVVDKNGIIVKEFKMPIYCISKTEEYALTLNFSRLANLRPDYGYFNHDYEDLAPINEDGIWKINLNSNSAKLLLSLEMLIEFKYSDTMDGATHKVNHIDISPNGELFMFLHRWIGPKGRFTRLMICNKNGAELRIINGDIMTSHCCWLNNSEILAYCNFDNTLGYFKFDLSSSKVSLYSENFPLKDGHPSISPNGKFIVLDTYPDYSRFSSLLIYDILNDKIKKIAIFHQPLMYQKEIRCDLHPKWGINSDKLFLESTHNGIRKLYEVANIL